MRVTSSVMTVSSTKVLWRPPFECESRPLFLLSGKAGVNDVESDGSMSKVTRSIRVDLGCPDLRTRSVETRRI